MKDVQSEISKIKIGIDKVGVKNVSKEFMIPKNGRYYFLSRINCYVNLPSKYRGIHMSRNIEAINEIISDVSKRPVNTLEELSENLCKEILKRHEYASNAYVEIKSYFPYKNEVFKTYVKCKCNRKGEISRKVVLKINLPIIIGRFKVYILVEIKNGEDLREVIKKILNTIKDANPNNIKNVLEERFGKKYKLKIIYKYLD